MQKRKELITFSALLALCLAFILMAGLTREVKTTKCPGEGNPTENCCQNPSSNSNTSPWEFITQGIFHISA
ncbi:MAG: hypothetical protein U0T68_00910 [Ferruginibacter sp.]